MRIIAGSARGTRLKVEKAPALRPTGDRQRETLFNVIRDCVPEASVLDLFAGSGALGLEALSRGAESCVFVEKERRTVLALAANVERCRLADKAQVVRSDWRAAMRRLAAAGRTFNLLLLDPPWAAADETDWLTATAAIAAPDAVLCLERKRGPAPAPTAGWDLARSLEVGDTAFHLFERVVPDHGGC